MWYQCNQGKGGGEGIYVDERLRHWISVSGTYGRRKRGMKWDTRHYKGQEYGYGTYRVRGGGTEERKTQWEFGYGTLG